jgi:hypothetical protein
MIRLDDILLDRLVHNEKKFAFFEEKFNLSKLEYDQKFKSKVKIRKNFGNIFIYRVYELFNSKIHVDKEIYKWNKNNSLQKKKSYVFSEYAALDSDGKYALSAQNFKEFYSHLKEQLQSQRKCELQNELYWIAEVPCINFDDFVCYYCGVNENILRTLYHDPECRCKTKRNRGAWFELDRRDSSTEQNIYKKDNMVFCCYFCNNHKSDVISSNDMRLYFGKHFFLFLMDKYESIIKLKII